MSYVIFADLVAPSGQRKESLNVQMPFYDFLPAAMMERCATKLSNEILMYLLFTFLYIASFSCILTFLYITLLNFTLAYSPLCFMLSFPSLLYLYQDEQWDIWQNMA